MNGGHLSIFYLYSVYQISRDEWWLVIFFFQKENFFYHQMSVFCNFLFQIEGFTCYPCAWCHINISDYRNLDFRNIYDPTTPFKARANFSPRVELY